MSLNTKFLLYIYGIILIATFSLLLIFNSPSFSEPRWIPMNTKSFGNRGQRNIIYGQRRIQSKCPHNFGSVMILVMYSSKKEKPLHGTAQRTLECYVKRTAYKLVQVDIDINERILKACSRHKMAKFRKYCAAAEFLKDSEWMLVIDDSTSVANPNHCIEEWIDDRVNLIFYEHFNDLNFSGESYLVYNSQWSIEFLRKLAELEFQLSAGHGNLAVYLVHTLLPNGKFDYQKCMEYWRFTSNREASICARMILGFRRFWKGKVRIYRRAHGWIREAFLTSNFWCDYDFMLHDWKEESIEPNVWISPFHDEIDPEVCAIREKGWNWLPNKYTNLSTVRSDFRAYEKMRRRNYPKDKVIQEYLEEMEVSRCYPECEKN